MDEELVSGASDTRALRKTAAANASSVGRNTSSMSKTLHLGAPVKLNANQSAHNALREEVPRVGKARQPLRPITAAINSPSRKAELKKQAWDRYYCLHSHPPFSTI